MLRVLLPELEHWAAPPRRRGRVVRGGGLGELASLPGPRRRRAPAWHLYVVRHPRADALQAALAAAGVESRAYYRVPVHRQPAMRRVGDRRAARDRRGGRAPTSRSRSAR